MRAYREQTAYGMISPKITIIPVETIKPITPDVKSAIRIDKAEFTVTLPSKIVQSNKLPLFLRGKIAMAYFASVSSSTVLNGPLVKSSKFLTSKPRRPRFKPENVPESMARITMKM
jgi:hypothetical protein